MRCLLLVALSSLAWAEPIEGSPAARHLALLKSELKRPTAPNLDSMFESAIRGAGFAIESGKLAFTSHGHTVSATVGRSQLTPLVDVTTAGAAVIGVCDSCLPGPAGNHEYIVYIAAAGHPAAEEREVDVERAIADAVACA